MRNSVKMGTLVLALIVSGGLRIQASTPVPVQLSGIESFYLRIRVWDNSGFGLVDYSAFEEEFTSKCREMLETAGLGVLDKPGFPRLIAEVTLYAEHPVGPIAVLGSVQVCDEVVLERRLEGTIPDGCATIWQSRTLRVADSRDKIPDLADEVFNITLEELLHDLVSANNWALRRRACG